jgi:hypothetical protein
VQQLDSRGGVALHEHLGHRGQAEIRVNLESFPPLNRVGPSRVIDDPVSTLWARSPSPSLAHR